ncbi:Hypothetical protein PROPJV5_1065 [Propionibacterium ruminifibrarum]|uniref:Uncharacterized protein n=1 Tax=Propionibacterium ruminifibrarum TaxID=1962131 RepID=A0A375I3X5_9ACTN|nr:Hypothetical protein PROPJV5_1065 [Propionibacterium ruminifibrarum]
MAKPNLNSIVAGIRYRTRWRWKYRYDHQKCHTDRVRSRHRYGRGKIPQAYWTNRKAIRDHR